MRIVVQRSLESSVSVHNKIIASIDKGLVILVGFTEGDQSTDIDYMIHKLVHLRIFDDEKGIMNLSIKDVKGEILSISQFTLYADTEKGNRPSYVKALTREKAITLYQMFNEKLSKIVPTKSGEFGADMKVSITNDGPVTILLERGLKDA